MHTSIKLIVGLGNPGSEYANTRHNAGAWFVNLLAEQLQAPLRLEPKLKSLMSRISVMDHECRLAVPTTYMNLSGQSVKAIAQFYKIAVEEILVAHDELDFAPGIIRLKQDGGAGGHNGLRDIVAHLQSANFHRLRIGIGHPGDRAQVHDYVLNTPSRSDHQLIMQSLSNVSALLPDIVQGHLQKVMRELHTKD